MWVKKFIGIIQTGFEIKNEEKKIEENASFIGSRLIFSYNL